jgi:hypothetical protein
MSGLFSFPRLFDTLRVKTTEILKTTILVLKALTNRLYTLKTTTNTRSIAIALTLIFLCFQSPSRPPVRYAQQFTIACLTRLRSSRGELNQELHLLRLFQHEMVVLTRLLKGNKYYNTKPS